MNEQSESVELDERSQRIIAAAIEMAEKDGYEAVRLRDLAAQAGVALGTVYRRFSCKEDILAAALDQQVSQMRDMMMATQWPGEDAEERLTSFFSLATQTLAQRPKLAGAMLRTVASGVPELSEKVTRYHGRMTQIILGVYRGEWSEELPSDRERILAELLQNVWFAALVGWTGGLHEPEYVVTQVQNATRMLLAGLDAQE